MMWWPAALLILVGVVALVICSAAYDEWRQAQQMIPDCPNANKAR